MNYQHAELKKQHMIGLKGSIESFQLWDSGGNCCAAALFDIGSGRFELYLHEFNDSIPKRVTGTLKECKDRMTLFHASRIEAGFEEALADQRGNPIN